MPTPEQHDPPGDDARAEFAGPTDRRPGTRDADGQLPVVRGFAALAGVDAAGGEGDGGGRFAGEAEPGEGPPGEEPWRRSVRRWLATLNPGRTQREYEKAVGYFFETPGVPRALDGITFDLLLAYRGALAMRASSRERVPPAARGSSRPRVGAPERARIAGESDADDEADEGRAGTAGGAAAPSPLAPATVNLRLTALRQFLVHCTLFGSFSRLTPDQIRAALRRLTIERRRPYQVLAEPEWEEFLSAARLPTQVAKEAGREGRGASGAGEADARREAPAARSPWGVPRAVRRRREEQARRADAEAAAGVAWPANPRPEPHPLPRSRSGLTGERTAQRDHALIALALATGLRAIELSSLDVGDLSREWHKGRQEWWLILPDAKTKGQRGGRALPLDVALMETLLAYLAATGRRWERPADRATPLFLSGSPTPAGAWRGRKRDDGAEGRTPARAQPRLSPSHIRRIVDRVETQWLALRGQEAAGEGGGPGAAHPGGEARLISPHALRHSTAIALLEGNETTGRPPASVEHVRGWLGHFDIRTTQGYLAHLEGRQHRRPFALSPSTHGAGRREQSAADATRPPRGADGPGARDG